MVTKKEYDKKQYKDSLCLILRLYLPSIIGSFAITVLCLFYFMGWFNFWFGVYIIMFGNYLIAFMTQYSHYRSRIDSKENVYPSFLRCLAGCSEMFFYTFFFVFKQPMFVIGYLVIKGVGLFHDDKNPARKVDKNPAQEKEERFKLGSPRDNDAAREGQSVAILRVAIIVSLFISLLASWFILNSAFSRSGLYKNILNVL